MWGAVRGVAAASLAAVLVFYALRRCTPPRVPRGVCGHRLLLLLAFVAGSRLLARTLIERPRRGASSRAARR